MTKQVDKITERVMRRLLREAYAPSDAEAAEIKHSQHVRTLMPLAVYVEDLSSEKAAILYSPQDVVELLRKYREAGEVQKVNVYRGNWKKEQLTAKSFEGAIRGVIQIREPANPCWKAWEVIASAGPGGADIARTVYGIAYALSPSGIIMPDRTTVSPPAKAAWAGVAAKGERKVLPLDDISLPVEKRRTPNLPDDDCELYRGKSKSTDPSKNPQLQNAYVATGKEKSMLAYLTAVHESFVKDLAAEDPALPQTLELYLRKGVEAFFRHHYPGSDAD